MRQYILILFFSFLFPDACNMEIAGHLEFDQGLIDLTGFKQDNREFAVVGLIQDAAAFVDITDPSNPVEVGRISGTTNTWRDLKYWKRHVYIGTEAGDGIKVVSVDTLDNPVLVYTITDFGSSHNIHIDPDGFLYIVGADEHDIWIYNLSIPGAPELAGTWDGEYLHDIEVYNNKLYGAAISSGNFIIIDVSDKANPTTILSHNTGGGSTHDCAITADEKILITADETVGGHIKIWDISDYDNINLVSEYMTHPNHSVHNIYVRPQTNLLIASYYVDGTRVLDISDPKNPVEVGYFDTSELTGLYDGNWGTYAYLPSGYIISSDRQNGLFIFSSPLSMDIIDWGSCPTVPTTPSIMISEGFIDSIRLSWDKLAESSIDGATGIQDFEGYRIYRSTDQGETWGVEADKIYDGDSVHVGWHPYVEFDLNSGINNNFTDAEVYPHFEYCYVVTSFDTGLEQNYIFLNGWTYKNEYPSLESNFSNMVCLSPHAQDIYTPPSEILFKENEANIGWFQITYFPHKVDTINTGLYKFEIEADVDSNSFQFSKIINPKLNIYEMNAEGVVLNSLMSNFPIYSIDDDMAEENKWIDVLGMYIRVNNHLNSLSIPVYGPALDTIIWQTGPIYSYDELLSTNLKYYTDVVTFNRRPYFDYLIEFGAPGLDTATHVAPLSGCSGNEANTLLPFRITNQTTRKKVSLQHIDKGINGESGANGDLGYGDCAYTRNERIRFYETGFDLSDLTKEDLTYNLSFDWMIQSEADNSNYPWAVGESVIIISRKMLHDGDSWLIDMDIFNQPPLANNEAAVIPENFKLSTPYPNPFNPLTKIEYSLPYAADVSLIIYDLMGRQVELLHTGKQHLGDYTITWNASAYSSGVYLVQMGIGNPQNMNNEKLIRTRKMVLLK